MVRFLPPPPETSFDLRRAAVRGRLVVTGAMRMIRGPGFSSSRKHPRHLHYVGAPIYRTTPHPDLQLAVSQRPVFYTTVTPAPNRPVCVY